MSYHPKSYQLDVTIQIIKLDGCNLSCQLKGFNYE
jgi:hypothetical protein